jgi:hypothetical protein
MYLSLRRKTNVGTLLEFRLPEWNELENVLKNTVVNEQVEINGWVSLDLNE